MKEEYGFSNAERGKLHRPDAQLNIPVYLDQDIENWVTEKAKAKGVDLQPLVNELLRKDKSLTQKIIGKDWSWYIKRIRNDGTNS